jgi:HK97 family phage prohead protease
MSAMRQTFPGSVRSVGEREFKFTAVTAGLGRDGHILVPAGVDLSEYRKVPVILWQHALSSPVARCTHIALVDGEVRGTAEFAPAGTSAAVDEAFGCVKSGVVGAVSVGFDIVDATPLDPKKGARAGLRISRSTLLEISLVSVPADVGALITQRAYRSAHQMKQIIRASEAISEAQRHHHDLRLALENDEAGRAMRAHRHIGRCLDTAERCLRGLSDGTDLQAQVSDGMSWGQSDGGRSYAARQAAAASLAPSVAQRVFEAAAPAPKPPTWSGGSVVHWTAGMREYLQSEALARSRTLVTHGIYSYAERQARLRQLSRCP